MVRGGLTLYAKWATVYSVTYNLNGGTGGSAPADSNTYTIGQNVTAAALPAGITPPGGRRFAGWNTRSNGKGTTVQPGRTIAMVRGGLTLYAKWATVYSVTYNLNGGTGGSAPADSNTYTIGQNVTAAALPAGITPPRGRRFAGWNTRSNGRGTTVQPGRTIAMVRGGLTLYARWRF